MTNIALPGNNRHPVDQLGQIRATIKVLEDREKELKAEISGLMADGDVLGGAEYVAKQVLSQRKGGIDEARLKAAGIDPDAFRKPPVAVLSLKVEPRAAEAA